MGKRKLSRQQRSRIHQRQSRISESETAALQGPVRSARVVSNFGQQVEIEWSDPPLSDERVRAWVRSNLPTLVPGDLVSCEADQNGEAVVVALQDRQSLLERPDKYGKLRPIAANIDKMGIVIAPQPEAHTDLIDRYLVAAELAGIEGCLVLNKVDLLDQAPGLPALVNRYVRIGYTCISCCGLQADRCGELLTLFSGGTGILVGQSGVGKSSLMQQISGDETIRIGSLSHAAAKGRHTTTTGRLYHLAKGGMLIDTPGIREFGLWHVPPEELIRGFREFIQPGADCRFRNCEHFVDAGCALTQACKAGKIHATRRDSYLRIKQALREDGIVMRPSG